MTTDAANPETPTQEQPYEHILSLIAQLTRNERLRLIMYICDTMLVRLNEDDEDELARDADEVWEYAQAHPETIFSWEDVQAELMLMDDEEPTLYEHTLIAVEQFTPMQWLHLVAHIAKTIEPLLDEDGSDAGSPCCQDTHTGKGWNTMTSNTERMPPILPPEQIPYDARISKQPTRTRRVFSTQQLDENGMLTLRIRCGESLAHAILKVEVHIEEPVPDPMPTPEELGWPPGFFEETAGSIPDFPLDADMSYSKEWQTFLAANGMLDEGEADEDTIDALKEQQPEQIEV